MAWILSLPALATAFVPYEHRQKAILAKSNYLSRIIAFILARQGIRAKPKPQQWDFTISLRSPMDRRQCYIIVFFMGKKHFPISRCNCTIGE